MIFVDSSVWIDYFNGTRTLQADRLDAVLGVEPVVIGDLIVTEVLQGFRRDRDYQTAKVLLMSLDVRALLGAANAVKTADNYRVLRKHGITVRKTVDCIIATYCIEHNLPLLHSDGDFEPFVKQLGLIDAMYSRS